MTYLFIPIGLIAVFVIAILYRGTLTVTFRTDIKKLIQTESNKNRLV